MMRKGFIFILVSAGIIAGSAVGFAQTNAAMQESRDTNAGQKATPSDQTAVNPAAVSLQKEESISQETVTGVVREIASDKSYVVVSATKIITTPAFIDESYIELGDKVKVVTAKTPEGLKAVDCSYVFDDMPETIAPENEMPAESSIEQPSGETKEEVLPEGVAETASPVSQAEEKKE